MKKLFAMLLCLALLLCCLPMAFADTAYDPAKTMQEQIDEIGEYEGALVITDTVTLTDDLNVYHRGICLQAGGELIVPEGKCLTNQGWIDLSGGKLVINGNYNHDGDMTFFPDQYGTGSLDAAVEGLSADMIACETTAATQTELESILSQPNTEDFQRIRAAVSSAITLNSDLTVPTGKGITIFNGGSLTVPAGKTLTLDQNATLTLNDGAAINLDGTLANNGQVNMWSGDASIAGDGTFVNNGGFDGDPKGLTVAVEGDEIYRPVYTEAELRQKLETTGWADVGGEITLEEDLRLEWQGINLVNGGNLIVPQGITLTNIGDIGLWGGYLEVQGTYADREQPDGSWGCVTFHAENYDDFADATNLSASQVNYEYSTDDFDIIRTVLEQNVGQGFQQIRAAFSGQHTLTSDLVIPAGKALDLRGDDTRLSIPEGKTLTVSQGAELTLDNRAEMILNGVLANNGNLCAWGESTIGGSGEIQNGGRIEKGDDAHINVTVSINEDALRENLENGTSYELFGSITLTKDLMINDCGLRLCTGSRLVVPANVTLKNFGWIDLAGGYLEVQKGGEYIEGEDRGSLDFFTAEYNDSIDSTKATNLPANMICAEVDVPSVAAAVTALQHPENYAFRVTRINPKASGTLNTSITIPEGIVLDLVENNGESIQMDVPTNVTITIASGGTLNVTNHCRMVLDGTVINDSTLGLWNDAHITGSGTIENNSWINIDDTSSIDVEIRGNQPGQDPNAVTTEEQLREKLASKKEEDGWINIIGTITLTSNLEIPESKQINLCMDSSLTVPANITLTNYGGIHLDGGKLTINGTYDCREGGFVTLVVDQYPGSYCPIGLTDGDMNGWVNGANASELQTWIGTLTARSFTFSDIVLNGSGTLEHDLTIPENISINAASKLTIPANVTVTNNGGLAVWEDGEIELDGKISNLATMNVDGPIRGNGLIENDGEIHDNGEFVQVEVINTKDSLTDELLRQKLAEKDYLEIACTVTLKDSLTIPAGKVICLEEGAELIVPSPYTLTNLGGIHMLAGKLTVQGHYSDGTDEQHGYIELYADCYEGTYVPAGLKDYVTARVDLPGISDLQQWMDYLSQQYKFSNVNLVHCAAQTLTADLTVPENVSLCIGTKLIVPASCTLTNNCSLNVWEKYEIELNGTINNSGWLCVEGTITGSGEIVSTGNIMHVENIAQSVTITESQPDDPNAIDTEEKLREKLASGETTVEISGSFSLTKDLEIPENKSVTLSEGAVLTVPEGCTLTSNGRFDIKGELVMNGRYINWNWTEVSGAITGSGMVVIRDGILNYPGGDVNQELLHILLEWIAPKEPTCGEAGSIGYFTCFTTGHLHNENYDVIMESDLVVEPTLDHKFLPPTVIKAPTCNSSGLSSSKCEVCGFEQQEIITATDHAVGIEATCTEHAVCAYCGKRFGSLAPHNYIPEVTTEPTCTEAGIITKTCSSCSKTETEGIEALGHDIVIDVEKVEPSCTEDGTTEGYHCTRCDLKIESETIAALGHTSVEVGEVAATCTEDGTTAGHKCERCGDVLDGCEVIEKLGHDEVPDEDEAPTATSHGKQGGTHCQRCGEVITAPEPVTEHAEKQTVTKATMSANGKIAYTCSVCGEKTKDDTVIPMVKTVTIASSSYTYNGKVISPAVTVKDAKGKALVKDTDYTVTYSKGCKDVGSYTVTVKGKGNYSFTKTLTFKINPVKTAIAKLTAGKKAFTVKWKKKTAQVTGYEIQYSLKKNFASGNKTVAVKGASTVSKTIKKLKGGKTYYVRIRTYKTVGKTKFYSDWSAAKSIKTKK